MYNGYRLIADEYSGCRLYWWLPEECLYVIKPSDTGHCHTAMIYRPSSVWAICWMMPLTAQLRYVTWRWRHRDNMAAMPLADSWSPWLLPVRRSALGPDTASVWQYQYSAVITDSFGHLNFTKKGS